MNNYQIITCGIIDQRYGEALTGTHHGKRKGESRTLCGRFPIETRSTIWFGISEAYDDSALETVTCKKCRKIMGLEVSKWADSKVML